jgi:subtilase family serine protease
VFVKVRVLALSSFFSVLFLSIIPGQAQQSPQPLHNHLRVAVSNGRAALVGPLAPEQRINLSIVLPLRNQRGLTGLLSRLYEPSSPDYHHFLSVAQFAEQFGPTSEDYQAVVDFAQANGFTVSNRPANRLIVPIIGTVTQVESTLHVRMNKYHHPTENRTFYSPDREPSLNLSVPVAHIAGLNNYSIPRPLVRKASAGQGAVNASDTGSGPGGSYVASDMRAAYYTSTIPTASTALTGSGQTVGLVEFDGYDISDVTSSFDGTATSTTSGSNYILAYTPAPVGTTYSIPINNVLLDGASGAACQETTSSCDDSEETLDIVQAIGMAPGLSQVRLYIGFSDVDILNSMATENIAKQISISWGWSPDDPSTDDALFQELAAQGQSVFAASGDDGVFDPLEDVSYPAEDAWLTAVGGTDLVTNSAGLAWNSEIAWTQSGGGISPDGIPIPSWQAGAANAFNAGSTTLRNVPDVAAEANFDNYDCDMGVCQGDWAGTSFATPRWAGFMALVNQQAMAAGNPTVGFINPALYTVGESSSYENDFHDITSGNNGATLYLAAAPIALAGFNAVTGYDLVTGWGSPGGQNLIDALAPPANAGFQLSASPSSLTLQPGTSGTTTITVQDEAGFTGKATLSCSGLPSGVTASFGASSATGTSVLTLSASSSAIRGSYLVTITGTSGSVTATTTLALVIDAPGFSLAPPPLSCR